MMGATEKKPFFKNIYDFHNRMYGSTGFGKNNFESKYHRILYRLYRDIMIFTYLVHIIIVYHEMCIVYNDMPMLSFTLSFVIIGTVGALKIGFVSKKQDELEDLQARLDRDLNSPWIHMSKYEARVKAKNARDLLLMTKSIYILAVIGISITIALPYVGDGKQKFFLPFPYPEVSETIFYVPLFTLHCFAVIHFILNFVSNDMVFIGLILRLCNNLEIVELSLLDWDASVDAHTVTDECLVNATTKPETNQGRRIEKTQEKCYQFLKRCIAHQQKVQRELKLVEEIYSYPIMLQLIFGPFLFGVLAYVVFSGVDSTELVIQQLFYAIPTAFFLFMYCYFGTRIAEKSRDLRVAFYSFPWYELDMRTTKSAILVLLRLETAGKMTAGNLIELDLTTYLSLAKLSYNLVTLLKKLT